MPQHRTQTIDLGPGRVARRRTVRVDAATLYAALANPHRHHELDGSGTVAAAVTGPERLSKGDTFSVAMRLGPLRYRMRNTVTEATPGHAIEWALPAGHRWRWELSPTSPDETTVTEVFDYRMARLPWLMRALGFPRRNGRGIEETLARLEAQFHSHPGA